jgi:triacylglycerol lipase
LGAGVYTFGQPCIGDAVFATKYDGLLQSRTFRFVNHNDLVPRLLELKFRHVGQIRYFDENRAFEFRTFQCWNASLAGR